MKDQDSRRSTASNPRWTEKLAEFLLGPLPAQKRKPSPKRDDRDSESARIALAMAGMSAHSAVDSTSRGENGRR